MNEMNSIVKIDEKNGTENPCSSSSFLHPMNINIVIKEIISCLGNDPQELVKFRLISHNWNDTIVRKLNKADHSFRIPLRYSTVHPQLLLESDAKRFTQQTLDHVMKTLTGTASKLTFDTVVIDNDFYLAATGVKAKLTRFLKIHGESIRHLKINIRHGKTPGEFENHLMGCDEVVSMQNLRAIFSSVPNLESLDFCIRFSDYNSENSDGNGGPLKDWNPKHIFSPLQVLKLMKLTKLTIREPHGSPYTRVLLKELISMAPNLTSLNMEPTLLLSTFVRALNSMEPKVKESLTSIRITGAHFLLWDEKEEMRLPFLRLTSLELTNINGEQKYRWMESLLQAHHSTLVKLILGNRKDNSEPLLTYSQYFGQPKLTFPLVMENLKILEMNLSNFKVTRFDFTFETRFPVLESLTYTGGGDRKDVNDWSFLHFCHLLPAGLNGIIKHFFLVGPIREGWLTTIRRTVRTKFPNAECHC